MSQTNYKNEIKLFTLLLSVLFVLLNRENTNKDPNKGRHNLVSSRVMNNNSIQYWKQKRYWESIALNHCILSFYKEYSPFFNWFNHKMTSSISSSASSTTWTSFFSNLAARAERERNTDQFSFLPLNTCAPCCFFVFFYFRV